MRQSRINAFFVAIFHCLASPRCSLHCVLQKHYLKDVPFHNCIHASDVTQTTHVLLSAQAFEVSRPQFAITVAVIEVVVVVVAVIIVVVMVVVVVVVVIVIIVVMVVVVIVVVPIVFVVLAPELSVARQYH